MQYTYKYSIVIPVYNRVIELKRALDSIHINSGKIQVVIVDDGSTLSYESLITKKYQFIDVCYVKIDNSGGPALPRNIGIKYAKGKWISFLDSDDYFDIKKFSFLDNIETLIENKNFIYHKVKTFGDKNKTIGGVNELLLRFILNNKCNPIVLSSVTIKKSFLLENNFEFDKELNSVEDYDLWLRIITNRDLKPYYINKVLGYYELGNKSSISLVSRKHILKYFKLRRKHIKNRSVKVVFELIIASSLLKISKRNLAKKILYGISIKENLFLLIKYLYLLVKI